PPPRSSDLGCLLTIPRSTTSSASPLPSPAAWPLPGCCWPTTRPPIRRVGPASGRAPPPSPPRRPCQWELTAAYLAAQSGGDPGQRILVLNPEPTMDHLHPPELRDPIFRAPPTQGDQAALGEMTQAIAIRVRQLPGSLGQGAPLIPGRWLPTQGLGSTRFVGRLPEMWQLHSALHPETTRL